MLDKIGSFLYHKVFVNIYIKDDSINIYVEKNSSKTLVLSDEKNFKTNTVDENIINYINSFTKDTPYFYISILDPSTTQGAAPTCEHIEIDKFYDKALSKYGCYKNKWSYYTSKYDLDEVNSNFREIGLDFIFSPFIILANFFQDKIDSNLSIFLLIQESSIALSIFDNSNLLFAQYLNLKNEFESESFSIDDDNDDEITLDEVQEESIDLDSVDVDDSLDDLDVFGDIEDLDSIEEIDEFTDVDDELEEEDIALNNHSNKNHSLSESEELFDEDYQMFSAVQGSIKTFYEDERYNSEFIENIYIADSIGVSGDLKSYLEEEIFLNVYIRQIDLGSEISKLAQVELK